MRRNFLNPNLVTWLIILFVLILAFIIPIEIPNNISVKGKIYPAKEWILTKGTDGQLVTTLFNYKKGVGENFTVAQFERGDAVEFSFSDQVYSGNSISLNDTIGIIYSNFTEKELIDLRSALAVDSALLRVNMSEQKESVVKSEEQKLEYAKSQLDEQQKIYRRQKSLYEKNLISQEEFEVAESAIELFTINVDIAEERLRTVLTGAKKEEIDLIKSRMRGLSRQIDMLEKKFSEFVIQSPVKGVVSRIFASDTLLTIYDTTDYIAVVPIHINDLKFSQVGQYIEFEDIDKVRMLKAEIVQIDKSVKSSINAQYFLASADFNGDNKYLLPGLVLKGKLKSEPLILRDLLLDFINIF